MSRDPNTYLLYEYMKKSTFTFRVKVRLDEPVDVAVLTETAREAFGRFPYYSVRLGLDAGENYTLTPNHNPIAVLPEEDRKLVLGSDAVGGHLFAITYRGDTIYFSCAHSLCGGFGIMFWVKTTLYLYLTKKYGQIEPPADIKLPGTPVAPGETFYPDPESLPKEEPLSRYNGGNCDYALERMIRHYINPFAREKYYYEIVIPTRDLLAFAKGIDASPNTLVVSLMYRAMTRFFKEKEGTHISARLCADYRDDIGASESHHDFVRFIHIKYEWSMKDDPIEKLNLRARGAVAAQNQPELSYERFRWMEDVRRGIDAQPTLQEKKKYAAENSLYRKDVRDPYTISYVGKVDFGGMEDHIKNMFTITDGDLMLEMNALRDSFNICFEVINKSPTPLKRFLEVLTEEGIPYQVSGRKTRFLPAIQFP